ncbi:MAG: RtcB family protein, partial [Candidatus Omnitrophica bacterium]|nr:RtcB family protein [Candidatus Omnitrophota bacterium]
MNGLHSQLEKIDRFRWRIPESYKTGMRVDGVIYASKDMLDAILSDKAADQVANVAFLPGIVKHSFAMPDIHWGYGFPIGGVAATDVDAGGVISPGGVGFDINCGIRLTRSNLSEKDVRPKLKELVYALYNEVPAGVGSKGDIRVSAHEERKLLAEGARWVVEHGYGNKEDLEYTEERGEIKGADPDGVSPRAYERGKNQSGTLGSGNHFLEVQVVDT